MLVDECRQCAKYWLIATALELDTLGAWLNEEVSHQFGAVAALHLYSGWRCRHFQRQAECSWEAIRVANYERPRGFILQ